MKKEIGLSHRILLLESLKLVTRMVSGGWRSEICFSLCMAVITLLYTGNVIKLATSRINAFYSVYILNLMSCSEHYVITAFWKKGTIYDDTRESGAMGESLFK